MFPFELKAFKNVGNIRKSQTYVKKKVTEKVAYWTMILVSRSSQFDLKSVNEGAKPQASLICEAVRAHLIEKRRLKNNRASRGRFGNKARPLQGYESGREKKNHRLDRSCSVGGSSWRGPMSWKALGRIWPQFSPYKNIVFMEFSRLYVKKIAWEFPIKIGLNFRFAHNYP